MLKFFGRKSTIYSEELGHSVKELAPLSGQAAPGTVFVSLPQGDILTLVERYISAMETEESEYWCRCEWITHLDDANVKPRHCRECNQAKNANNHHVYDAHGNTDISYVDHPFKGVRKRRGDTDATCPVHTREGLIIYFFEWVFTDAAHR